MNLLIKCDKTGETNSFGDKELVISVRDTRITEGDDTVKVFDFTVSEGEHHTQPTLEEAIEEVSKWVEENEKNYRGDM